MQQWRVGAIGSEAWSLGSGSSGPLLLHTRFSRSCNLSSPKVNQHKRSSPPSLSVIFLGMLPPNERLYYNPPRRDDFPSSPSSHSNWQDGLIHILSFIEEKVAKKEGNPIVFFMNDKYVCTYDKVSLLRRQKCIQRLAWTITNMCENRIIEALLLRCLCTRHCHCLLMLFWSSSSLHVIPLPPSVP